jgi:succinate dehydrogenase / fumarate reductase, membrane anchor subunit
MGNGTDIGRVRGLGSAKHGGGHWMTQRMTAAGNLLLAVWLVVALLRLPNFEFETVSAWLSQPIAAIPMLLFILNLLYHIRLGLQVLIEDYVHDDGNKLAALFVLNIYVAALAVTSIFMILKIAFTGAPA